MKQNAPNFLNLEQKKFLCSELENDFTALRFGNDKFPQFNQFFANLHAIHSASCKIGEKSGLKIAPHLGAFAPNIRKFSHQIFKKVVRKFFLTIDIYD